MSDHIIENIDKKGDAFSEWKRKTILQTMRGGLQEIHKDLDEFFNTEKEKINIDEYKDELLRIIYAAQSVLSLSDSRSRYDISKAQDHEDIPF